MYSYDDRIRAVELYIKLGKRNRATIRQLGFPTKNALKGWYREYKRRGYLAKGFHRAPKYSMAQQQAVVDHFLHHGRCIALTRRALGYPSRCVLRSWIFRRHPDLCQRIVGRSRAVPRPLEVKQAAVIAFCTRHGKARAIAQDLRVSRETLYNWKDQLFGREASASMKRQNKPPADPDTAHLEQQLEALKVELRPTSTGMGTIESVQELLDHKHITTTQIYDKRRRSE